MKKEEVALRVQEKLSSGEKFETLASNYNEAHVIEKNLARGEYPEAVDAVAFRLDNDEQSQMITTDEGYYFIKCIIIIKRQDRSTDSHFDRACCVD